MVNFFVVRKFSSLGDFVSSIFSHLLLTCAMHSGKMYMPPSFSLRLIKMQLVNVRDAGNTGSAGASAPIALCIHKCLGAVRGCRLWCNGCTSFCILFRYDQHTHVLSCQMN